MPRIRQIVGLWESYGGATLFTRFRNHPGSQYERLLGWDRCSSPPETEICLELQHAARLVINKHLYTAFTDETKLLFTERAWEATVICGIATEGCVLKTAVDAFELGHTPYVLKDACASTAGPQTHEIGLYVLERFIGREQVLEADSFFSQALQCVGS